MPKGRKKFIDKKKAVTFQLVHRSQQDPLIVNEDAPQRVLLPVADKQSAQDSSAAAKEEQHKYGIYFDDDTNYMTYLKDPGDNQVEWPGGIRLPAQVFASAKEDPEGMLSKAAPISGPQLHLDPDVVAAMDEDFDYSNPENQLEDNFIDLADGVASDQDFDEEFEIESDYGSEKFDEVGFLPCSEKSFGDDETKSRFTNYSMSSSVIRRNDQLTLLDGRFEKIYADYDDNEIGALDCEEIEGEVSESSNVLLQCADEFEKTLRKQQLDKDVFVPKAVERFELSDSELDNGDLVLVELPIAAKWDCESILSTYSNIYNHPKLIVEPERSGGKKIHIDKRTGIPLNVLGAGKLTSEALQRLDEHNNGTAPRSAEEQSVISRLSELSVRPKWESPDEKRDRKKLIKEYRRERRVEKKANKDAFKEEVKRQGKIIINNRNNVQGNKIM